jgi:N-acetyltransferase
LVWRREGRDRPAPRRARRRVTRGVAWTMMDFRSRFRRARRVVVNVARHFKIGRGTRLARAARAAMPVAPSTAAGQRPINAFFRVGAGVASEALAPRVANAAPGDATASDVTTTTTTTNEKEEDAGARAARAPPPPPAWSGDDDKRGGAVVYKRRRRRVDADVAATERATDADADATTTTTTTTTTTSSTIASTSAASAPMMKQLFLDLGQKNFGHVTCATCGLLYAKGEPADERTHDAYHARFLASRGVAVAGGDPTAVVGGGVACPKNWGLSDAAHVSQRKDRWIVKCVASDHAKRWGKVKDVAAEVETALGMSPGWIVDGDGERTGAGAISGRGLKAFLCVVRGGGSSASAASTGGGDRIVGALFAEPITHARRTLPDGGGGKTDRRDEDAERMTTKAAETSAASSGASYTLVPIRPRRRGERDSLRTLPGVSLRPGSLAFNPRLRRLSTPPDAFELHPDFRSYRTALARRPPLPEGARQGCLRRARGVGPPGAPPRGRRDRASRDGAKTVGPSLPPSLPPSFARRLVRSFHPTPASN